MRYFVGQKVLVFFGDKRDGTMAEGLIIEERPGDGDSGFLADKYLVGCPMRGSSDWSTLQEFVMFEHEITTMEEVFGAQVQAR